MIMRPQREQVESAVAISGGAESGTGTAALRELCILLAENAELAREKVAMILGQASIAGSFQDGSVRLNARHLSGVLALAQYNAHLTGPDVRRDLWNSVVEFLRAFPYVCMDDFWQSASSLPLVRSFFSEFMQAVLKIAEMNTTFAEEVSSVIALILPKVIEQSNRDLKSPIAPGIKSFLVALAQNCPSLWASDAEEVAKCLIDQWYLNFLRRSILSSESSETSYHSSPGVAKNDGCTPSSNGPTSPSKDSYGSPTCSQSHKINGNILSSKYQKINQSPNSTACTSPNVTPVSTPSKLLESQLTTPRSGQQNGTFGSTSGSNRFDHFYSGNSDEGHDGGPVLRSTRDPIEDESLQILERQELAFRLASQILERTRAGRQLRDIPLHQLRNAAVTLLRTVLPVLKIRRQDWPVDGEELKTKLDLKFQASQEASVLQTRCLLLEELDTQSKGSVRESFPLYLDIAEACLASPWRKLKTCEDLFDSLLTGVTQVAAVLGSPIQRSVLLRLKSIILSTCAQAEVFDTSSQSRGYESIVKSTCILLKFLWDSDKTSVESFLSSLAAHVRERVEKGEEERHVIFIQTNLTSFLSDVVEKFNKWEIVEIILPTFIECFEQREISLPAPLRVKLMQAIARLGTLGSEKSYREVVVLLTRDYLDKVSSIEAKDSKGLTSEEAKQIKPLTSEINSEHLAALTVALVRFCRDVEQCELRTDLRKRLLTLCSNVGLLAEAKDSRIGGNLLGPLLPAIAEICSDFDPTQDVEPSLLKLFRNLWFYIALFGLGPPVQGVQSSLRHISSPSRITSSVSSGNIALRAIGGAYMWNVQWSEAAKVITQGTPPLVVSSVKWLEDEVELNALHNPGSRRGSNNEKAALTQRTALSAAIGGLLDTYSLNAISGVKSTYLLGVAILEILRFGQYGGVLAKTGPTGGLKTALTCAFKYLETPDLLPIVQQCLAAIVHQAFNSALTWLGDWVPNTEELVAEREAILAAHTCFLIRASSHREENVRDMAENLLGQFRTRFPQVLWNPQCLDELLRVVVDVSQPASTNSSAAQLGLRALWNQRVREWITHALIYAPCTVQGLLQEQFRKLNTWQKATQTSDLLSLLSDIRLDTTKTDEWSCNINIPAVLAAAAAAAGTSRVVARGNSMEVLSTAIVSANVKSNHAGEITGMQELYAGIGGLTMSSAKDTLGPVTGLGKCAHRNTSGAREIQAKELTLHYMLTTRFVQLLQQFVITAEKGAIVDAVAFRDACLRGTALLLSVTGTTGTDVPEGFDQLLRLLCWCPAHIFSPQTMETGIFVWTWLLSAAPHWGSRVLSELVDAWLWTIDSKRGIFGSGINRSGPAAKLRPQLTPGEPASAADEDYVQGIHAHNIWLGFLLDRFEVVKNASSDQLFLLCRFLQGSVKSTTHFSCHPAATGTFFTLMLLGLKFCSFQAQVRSGLGTKGITLLENRFYRAALSWFSTEPGWYDSNVEGTLEAEAQTMAIFVQHLTACLSKGNSHEQSSLRTRHGCASSHSINGQVDLSHPVWGKAFKDYAGSEKAKMLLLMLCQCEADRLETWAHPLNKELASRAKVSADQWLDFAKTAWNVDPRIALSLVARFPAVAALRAEVTSLVQGHLTDLFDIPEALRYFVTPRAVEEDSAVLQYLPHWAPCSITHALEFLTPAYKGHHRVMAYVLRVLETYPPERVTFFMPQLVQSLRYDQKGLVEGYLMVAAQRSNLFAHILIWQLQGEEAPTAEEASKEHQEAVKNELYDIVPKVRQRIIDRFTPEAYNVFLHEFNFFDKITSISGVLYPLPKDERRAGIRRELEKIQVESQDLYLPTAPNKLVRGIQRDSGIPLQSAAKVPIMITFDVINKDGDPNDVMRQACIFKVGDDCRQDVLALQVIALLRDIFEAAGINLYLFPYGVLPTGYGRGIIEVVPNTRSRNQMAEITDGGLLDNFQQDFGAIGSTRFEAARDNFIVSSAGYAVASLLLQPKDRHNGNLLFDKDGRLVHIDFGFILETSPGGNMRFESADFKLSHEMTQLLDPSGIMKSEPWQRFVSLCVKGYLTARQHMDGILNTVLIMKDSGLPCFSRGDPVGNLRKRFHPEMSEREASNFMIKTCEDAYNKWTTTGYDLIQYLQQGIEK